MIVFYSWLLEVIGMQWTSTIEYCKDGMLCMGLLRLTEGTGEWTEHPRLTGVCRQFQTRCTVYTLHLPDFVLLPINTSSPDRAGLVCHLSSDFMKRICSTKSWRLTSGKCHAFKARNALKANEHASRESICKAELWFWNVLSYVRSVVRG